VGLTPPNKTTVQLLIPPVPCLIGFNGDESEVLYGIQIYEALGKKLPSPETGLGSVKCKVSSFLNLKSMLADKEVEWRKGKARVKSELPLTMFLIHVKAKIEAAMILPSSSTNFKVILVVPQVLSIVQRGRISDATKLAGFGEDQVHFIKETTAAALAFAEGNCWSPGSMLSILVCCPQNILDLKDKQQNNVDVGIFSNEDGILSMEESAGRQGLVQNEVLEEMRKFRERIIVPFGGKLKKNSVFVQMVGSYEEVSRSRQDEMQDFWALLVKLHELFERSSASQDLLQKPS
jgi:hypothetical protein